MSSFAGWGSLAKGRDEKAAGRAAADLKRKVGRDKSACHERRKPLTRLGFSRAWRSVACIAHGFCEGFQGSGVADAPSTIGGAVR